MNEDGVFACSKSPIRDWIFYENWQQRKKWKGFLIAPSLVAQWKEPTCQCRRHRFDPCSGKIPWRRKWQPTPVFLPGEPPGQKSLSCYSPQGHKESWLSDWMQCNWKVDFQESLDLGSAVIKNSPSLWTTFLCVGYLVRLPNSGMKVLELRSTGSPWLPAHSWPIRWWKEDNLIVVLVDQTQSCVHPTRRGVTSIRCTWPENVGEWLSNGYSVFCNQKKWGEWIWDRHKSPLQETCVIQSIFIIGRVCIYSFAYLLELIHKSQINTHSAFPDIQGTVKRGWKIWVTQWVHSQQRWNKTTLCLLTALAFCTFVLFVNRFAT